MSAITEKILARIEDFPITTATADKALVQIVRRAKAGEGFAVFTLNLDHLVKLRDNEPFRNAYASADIVTADGWPIAWIARSQDRTIRRVTGADLVVPVVESAARHGLAVFLFGSSQEVMARAAQNFSDRTEGAIDLAGTLAPGQNFDPTGAEADEAIEQIRASGARICLVALGAPKQELFSHYAKSRGLNCGLLCIGAGLDFIAGAQVRAPKLFRNTGLEWAWRLAQNPRRLAKRYFDCAVILTELTVINPLRHRFVRQRV